MAASTPKPAHEPPSGIESNFMDPYTQHPTLVAVSAVCLILTTSAICIRVYTRGPILKQFDMTDYAIILSGMLYAAFTAMQIGAGESGQGRHQWDVTASDFSNLLRVGHTTFFFMRRGQCSANVWKHCSTSTSLRSFTAQPCFLLNLQSFDKSERFF
jgi:hypothetical protein